jgi:hypothetical protein
MATLTAAALLVDAAECSWLEQLVEGDRFAAAG